MNEYLNPIINIPYPEIKVDKKDPDFAYKLFKIFADKTSELTASMKYSYQQMILKKYKDLANIFKQISITEMKHFNILGELIIELGLKPYFVNYKSYDDVLTWNSDYVNYTDDYKEILNTNISDEKKAIAEYKKLMEETDDENIKNIFSRIIKDEKKHIEIFDLLLNEYNANI